MTSSKELAISGYRVPELNGDLSSAMNEELDGLSIHVDRAKIPSGGGLAFELPGDDPESPELTKEIVGVIVDHYPINSYWKEKYNGQNTLPDCFSIDGKYGLGIPGGECKNCSLNRFGTAETGEGKACKNAHALYILRDGDMLPIALSLPPTSIRAFSDFLAKRIVAKGLRSYGVVSKISLKKAVNASGITYSQAQFAVLEKLNNIGVDTMRQFSEQIRILTRRPVTSDEIVEVDYETGEVIEAL